MEKEWTNGDLRVFLRKAKKWQTWNNVARWQFGIERMDKEISWWKINRINQTFRQEHLKNAAIINIKKVPGSESSNMKEIWDYAWQDSDFLKKQIDKTTALK